MLNILLVVHLVISLLLVVVILMQRSGNDSLAGLGGGSGNMGLVSARSVANFFSRVTVVLAVLFMGNALLLANLSGRSHSKSDITDKLIQENTQTNSKASSKANSGAKSGPMAVPMAK